MNMRGQAMQGHAQTDRAQEPLRLRGSFPEITDLERSDTMLTVVGILSAIILGLLGVLYVVVSAIYRTPIA